MSPVISTDATKQAAGLACSLGIALVGGAITGGLKVLLLLIITVQSLFITAV